MCLIVAVDRNTAHDWSQGEKISMKKRTATQSHIGDSYTALARVGLEAFFLDE